jgi:hypothetical protein
MSPKKMALMVIPPKVRVAMLITDATFVAMWPLLAIQKRLSHIITRELTAAMKLDEGGLR